jgi:hypothetical protein
MLLRPDGSTASDGTHEHLWLVENDIQMGEEKLYKGQILVSFYDGAHTHAVKKGTRTTNDGAHKHGVTVGYSARKTFVTAEDAAHSHELLVRRTAHDGIHSHVLEIDGFKLKSLMPDDILALMSADEKKAEAAAEQITRNTRCEVRDGDTLLCKHDNSVEAAACQTIRRMWALKGFVAPFHTPNLHAQEQLFKTVTSMLIEKAGPLGVGDRLMGAMSRLIGK